MIRNVFILTFAITANLGHAAITVPNKKPSQSFRILSHRHDLSIERVAGGWTASDKFAVKGPIKRGGKDLAKKNMNAHYEHLRSELQQVLAAKKSTRCTGQTAKIEYADLRKRSVTLCLKEPREAMIVKRFETLMSYAFQETSWHPLGKKYIKTKAFKKR